MTPSHATTLCGESTPTTSIPIGFPSASRSTKTSSDTGTVWCTVRPDTVTYQAWASESKVASSIPVTSPESRYDSHTVSAKNNNQGSPPHQSINHDGSSHPWARAPQRSREGIVDILHRDASLSQAQTSMRRERKRTTLLRHDGKLETHRAPVKRQSAPVDDAWGRSVLREVHVSAFTRQGWGRHVPPRGPQPAMSHQVPGRSGATHQA